jgi:hypothetical protein
MEILRVIGALAELAGIIFVGVTLYKIYKLLKKQGRI